MSDEESKEQILDSITERFSKLLENAPDGPEHEEEHTWTPQVQYAQYVKESNGWGKKYVEKTELHGEEWFRTFDDACEMVQKNALVAFLGDRGPGKTQMAAEIARFGRWPCDASKTEGRGFWAVNHTGKTALYRRAMDIFLDLRGCNKHKSERSEADVLGELQGAGLLVIDEFQERGETDWENRVLTNLLDKRYAAERPTILIANFNREEMSKALSPSIRDRMHENGKSYIFDWKSYRRKP